ncbi:TPA: DUF4435 domain-containing protein [Enterobacter hormaechei]|uniref:DUF4435 domain-containing protein n=1 Tax=Enterobacter hormaechei TaxID=158836 RepID=UPI001251C6E2|nr:DUF4435 domain-containing protein [Enterobacter hormaechei]MCU3030437.1 DUF4435 domain-containing protein [Enterobacter hormaechei subsp. hoffmannii]CAF3242984.1 hypothetical protein AI3013V2_2782 [Enterobacter cloacae]MDU7899681.1 DUF4435 domain-containing protein [Enterobacter hormaechei]QMI59804.1 DUF4435 domain-containing protein [Enterobacter hormaechei]CAH5692126.1 hypothetical protein AI3013V2_2782 [Enterobacter cloacae]
MLFSRTIGGLSAQKVFYGADLIAYIEGKVSCENNCIYDDHFYSAIFKEFLPNKNIKIKILGNCNDVLDVYYKIINNNIPNSFAIVDRDYDGVLYSRLKDYRLIFTYGYSWENDFWSQNMCRSLLGILTMQSKIAQDEFFKRVAHAERRLCFAHRVNLSCKLDGSPLFILGKKGGDNGIAINLKSNFLITKNETKKFFDKIKQKNDRAFIINFMCENKLPANRSIQGHFWEYLSLQTLNAIVKKHSIGNTTAPPSTLKNMAFASFKGQVNNYLARETYQHYQSCFNPFI